MLLFRIISLPGRGRGRRGPQFQSPRGPQQTPGGLRVRSELKTSEQILKQRKKNQKHQFLQGGGMKRLRTKNKQWLGEVKKSGFGRGGQKKGKMRKRMWGGRITEGWCCESGDGGAPWGTEWWVLLIPALKNVMVPVMIVDLRRRVEEIIYIIISKLHRCVSPFSSSLIELYIWHRVCVRMIRWTSFLEACLQIILLKCFWVLKYVYTHY